MSRALLAILLVLSAGAGFACSKQQKTWRDHVFVKVDRTRPTADSPDTRLPRSLWEKIQALAEPSKSSDEVVTVFKPLSVYLLEKNKGILHQGPYEIQYGQGGGELDLKDYVQKKNGSFYFMADFAPELTSARRHVFFVSNSIERKRANEKIGTGCNSYFDVTSAFDKALKNEGFLVNTSDARHVGALAGSYFFTAVQDGKLYLASLIVKDSGYDAYHCR
jgi:hypothetical protein